MDLCYVELHSPLFTCTGVGGAGVPQGINWGVKLYEKNSKGALALKYSPQNNWIEVVHTFQKAEHTAIVPIANVVTMWPKEDAKGKEISLDAPTVKNQHVTEDGRKRRGAQVSTPHGHVFDGEGAGKIRDK